jgi:chromosome segregation ATPase
MAIQRAESSWMAGTEQKIIQLEREKIPFEASLSTSRAKAETTLEQLKNAHLEAKTVRAEVVEARRDIAAKEEEVQQVEAQCQAAHQTIGAYREAVRAWAEPLQEDIINLLARLGLEAPELSPKSSNISISELFRWLRACVAMADSGNRMVLDAR